jgi:hypothetical protein
MLTSEAGSQRALPHGNRLFGFAYGMTSNSALDALADEIRTADAVVVIGAGLSFQAGMPLAGHLAPLIWHALDLHPVIKQLTCDTLGVLPGTAKDVIGLDWKKVLVAFSCIAGANDARRTFQCSFARLDQERALIESPAHTALARLIHCGRALYAISLNWDTLLESAFRREYGIDLNSETAKLWKPHGDCTRPEEDWILPHEPGSVSDEIVERMTALARDRPRVLLIVGYSERDDVVVERLIRPLQSHWRVFRIGPGTDGEGAIRLDAAQALEYLAQALCPEPEFPGWTYVSFADQRGIQAAISGERLGPRDVEACPRLPHFADAERALELLNNIEIAGGPGCGKSITAWQLASDYSRRGWEVLRPNYACSQPGSSWTSLMHRPLWNRVVVVDDAQIFQDRLPERLAELAGPKAKVIRATTDAEGERPSSMRLPAKAAVEALAAEMRRRHTEILPIVRRYDPQVGDGYMDIPLERRISEAEEADTPWQFAYILRGGWSQARRALSILRDFNRTDLLLLSIASRQIASLDAGCKLDELLADASHLEQDAAWANDGLDLLRRQSAILPGTPIRCPHIQAAASVIRQFFRDRKDSKFAAVVSLLRHTCIDEIPPLRGISWLLRELHLTDAFRGTGDLISPADADKLVQRCCKATSALERRDAGFLISTLLWHRTLAPPGLAPYYPVLRTWLETTKGDSAYGLGVLVNDLSNADKHSAQQLVESVDPLKIAGQLANAQTAEGFAWGHFLGRLCIAGKDWRNAFSALLPRDRIHALASEYNQLEIGHLSEYLSGVAAFDADLALECLTNAIPAMQKAFAENPIDAFADIHEIHWRLLGHPPFGEKHPSKAQRRLSKTITNAIRPERVVIGFCSCRYGDWERYAALLYWVREVNPGKHRKIVEAVDWERLDDRAAELWHRPPREFRLLLHGLVGRQGDTVRKWIAKHAELIAEIDPIMASLSPEAAVAVIHKGGRLNLGGHNQSDWRLQAIALSRVAEVAKDVAIAALDSDQPRIAGHLAKLGEMDCEELPAFLAFIDQLAPGFLAKVFAAVDPGVASESWPKFLLADRQQVRQGARKVFLFAYKNSEGTLKSLAERLSTARPRRVSGRDARSRE